MNQQRTQVIVIGGGPAGLMLSHILHRSGIESIVIERQTRDYVLSRIRAGVLESGTVSMLREHGLGERMDRDGAVHAGTYITWGDNERHFIDVRKYTGRDMMAWGQTVITEDLYAAADKQGRTIIHEASDVAIHDADSKKPWVTYTKNGQQYRIDADFVAGCDGFHGVSRKAIPSTVLKTYEKVYPFGWLGIMSRTRPYPEIIYGHHERGFAMCSQRSPQLSRYYVQVPLDNKIEDWSDERFWAELKTRMGSEVAREIETGPSIEKSIAPLRSFVAEPMRYGSLFLAGDAAHIVPPTGAKGLNLAFSDVYYLSRALISFYQENSAHYLDTYSATALARIWDATRLSWWLTNLLHSFPEHSAMDRRLQEAELSHLHSNEDAQAAMCESYVGLPF